ncbi:ribokinase [Novosphingobium sp. 1949]|uniref:Ribokinase n=1 Tax=Novosphingobium organovorum TaxID=2930092 RepID=A0ABT0BFG6_9SPHN|nr:ribokinase [Novosphingobium organovorum]MCJ2183787.1 ribokinase [Novosphingobium organovorum]
MAVHIVGSINIDIITSLQRLPLPGETVLADATARLPGGKGANQGVAAARMGAAVRFTGAVGEDDSGAWMRQRLAREGIDIEGIRTLPGEPTGTAYIAVDAQGENQIIVVSGANARLTGCEPVADGVLLSQLEVPIPTLTGLFAKSRALRILNTAPALIEARALFVHVDILVLNRPELDIYAPDGGDSGGENEYEALARRTRALFCREDQAAIVTLGAAGALVVRPERFVHVASVPVRPVDTVGAGDCFCGALAALLDEGRSIEAAVPFACAAAALSTLSHGAAPSMPTRAAVADLLCEPATEHALPIKNRPAALLP